MATQGQYAIDWMTTVVNYTKVSIVYSGYSLMQYNNALYASFHAVALDYLPVCAGHAAARLASASCLQRGL